MGGLVAGLEAISTSGDEGAGPENQVVPIDRNHNSVLTVAQINGLADFDVLVPLQEALSHHKGIVNRANISPDVKQPMLQSVETIERMVAMLDLDIEHTRIECENCGNGAHKIFRDPDS